MGILSTALNTYNLYKGIRNPAKPANPVAPNLGSVPLSGSAGVSFNPAPGRVSAQGIMMSGSTSPMFGSAPVAPMITPNVAAKPAAAPKATPAPIMAPKAPVAASGGPAGPVGPATPAIGGPEPVTGTGTGSGETPAPAQPPAPMIPPETQAAVNLAEKAYQDSLKISPDELSTQADLDHLIESTKKGYDATTNQPIALDFITGQMAAIERRALGLAEPLERKLARMQAQRTSSQEASKFALERTDKKAGAEMTYAKDMRTEAEGTRRFNETQATDKSQFSQSIAMDEKKFNEDVRQFGMNYALQQKKMAQDASIAAATLSAGTDGKTGNPVVDGWVTGIKNGSAKIGDVPKDYKNAVMTALSSSGQDASVLQKEALSAAQVLKTMWDGGNRGAVGKSAIFGTLPGTQRRDFSQQYDNLVGKLSLDAVKYLKGQGAVSDAERKLLADSATNLKRSSSEATFKTNLDNIITVLGKYAGGSDAGGSTGKFTSSSGKTYNLPN